MAPHAQFRFLLLGIAITPSACARACAKPDMAVGTPSPWPSSAVVASLGLDAADGTGSVPSAPASSSAASAGFLADGGGGCADVFVTVSSCEALRALIAAVERRPELRACLRGLHVAPPPGNGSFECYSEKLDAYGCLRRDPDGEGVTCQGARGLSTTEHYDGFKKMAADCLAGWQTDDLESPAKGSVPRIEFSRTMRDRGRETVTYVEACKLTSNGEEVMAGELPKYDLDIDIYTTTRQLEAGAR